MGFNRNCYNFGKKTNCSMEDFLIICILERERDLFNRLIFEM